MHRRHDVFLTEAQTVNAAHEVAVMWPLFISLIRSGHGSLPNLVNMPALGFILT